MWQLLKLWLASLVSYRPFSVNLYVNQLTPPLSQNFGDYTLPSHQWPGYIGVLLPSDEWTDPQVSENIATTAQTAAAVFQLSAGNNPVTVWGYVVTDVYSNFLWSEQFGTALVVPSPGTVQLTPTFNLTTLPVPSSSAMVRVGQERIADDGDGDGDEED